MTGHRCWNPDAIFPICITLRGAGHSSGSRASNCEGFDYPINPAQWSHSQFGVFSILTSGSQLLHQRLWYVLSWLVESAYKRSLAAYRKVKPMWQLQVSSKEICHNDHISDSWWHENQCALAASLNKTNFSFTLKLPYPGSWTSYAVHGFELTLCMYIFIYTHTHIYIPIYIYIYRYSLYACVVGGWVGVMKTGNIVPRVESEPTSLGFCDSILTITPPRLPDVTILPTPICLCCLLPEVSADY